MNLKNTKERADLVWQLNKVGDYNTHKELWDAFYALEKSVNENSVLADVSVDHECKFYVNANWTELRCECGKSKKPSEL